MLQDTAKFQLLGHTIKSFLNQAQNRLGNHQQPWKFWKPESQKLKQCLRTFEQRFWNWEEEAVSCQDQSATRAFKRWCLYSSQRPQHTSFCDALLSPSSQIKTAQPRKPRGHGHAEVHRSSLASSFPLPIDTCRTGSSKATLPAACRASTSLNYTSLQNLLFEGQFSHT